MLVQLRKPQRSARFFPPLLPPSHPRPQAPTSPLWTPVLSSQPWLLPPFPGRVGDSCPRLAAPYFPHAQHM